MIRALTFASLALLIAGAVSPLLTTEQFWFFSNTISLVSGLGQLAVNDQRLIAAIIGLFSLCFPVFKAVVTWTAATPAGSRGTLLALADRFGKWSMLEVFVAALLILALKLSPIVDATLHYGIWLLTGSVVLSGVASQLLAREQRPKQNAVSDSGH